MRACFYDTWGFLALANLTDPHHAASVVADRALRERAFVTVTSDYIIDETVTGLSVTAGASVAVALLDVIEARVAAGDLTVLEVTRPRRERATELFRRIAPDAERLSFTDCTSFALMLELGLTIAFTGDRHFHRPGGGVRPLFERVGSDLVCRLPEEDTRRRPKSRR